MTRKGEMKRMSIHLIVVVMITSMIMIGVVGRIQRSATEVTPIVKFFPHQYLQLNEKSLQPHFQP